MKNSLKIEDRKTFWQTISPWFDKKYYAFTTGTIIVGLLFFLHFVTKPKVKSESDLYHISGQLSNYSFKDSKGARATGHQYYIWLDNYSNTFQIKADYLGFFKQKDFEKRVSQKQILNLTIPNELRSKLNTNEKIFIFSVDTDSENFLDTQKTLDKENNNFEIYAGLSFFLFGLTYFVIRKYWLTPKD